MKADRPYGALVVDDPDGRPVELVYAPSGESLADAVRAVGGGDFLHAERRCVAVGVAEAFARDHPAVQLGVSTARERRARVAAEAASNARLLAVGAAALACAWKLSGVFSPALVCAALGVAWLHGGGVEPDGGGSACAGLWAAAAAALWCDRLADGLRAGVRTLLAIAYPHCCDLALGCRSGCTCAGGALDGRLCDVAACAELPNTLSHGLAFAAALGAYAVASDRDLPAAVPWGAACGAAVLTTRAVAAAGPAFHSACLACWTASG